MSDDKINVVGTNIREKATVIWNVANHLFGYFKPEYYIFRSNALCQTIK